MRNVNTAPSHNIFVKTIYTERYYQIILTNMNLNMKKEKLNAKLFVGWRAAASLLRLNTPL